MAVKKFIIKQYTNWNTKGEKSGTSTVQMDEADIATYIGMLDGKIEVFEQNETLSVDASTTSSSYDVVDYVSLKHSVLRPIYISNSNKRPIVFKTPLATVKQTLGAFKPFPAPYAADISTDVSADLGNLNLL